MIGILSKSSFSNENHACATIESYNDQY